MPYVRRPVTRELFLADVDVRGPDECWPWLLGHTVHGRARKRALLPDGSTEKEAHRVSYRLFCGPIPEGLNVLHTCDNGWCVNYHHLETGTQSKNIADCYARNRRAAMTGSENGRSVLSEDQRRDIRRRWGRTKKCAALAREYGVDRTTILRVGRGHA